MALLGKIIGLFITIWLIFAMIAGFWAEWSQRHYRRLTPGFDDLKSDRSREIKPIPLKEGCRSVENVTQQTQLNDKIAVRNNLVKSRIRRPVHQRQTPFR